jgi:hypothetical protein
MYIEQEGDVLDKDTSLEPDTLNETFMLWQNPTEADQDYHLEQQLFTIKDTMLDNLTKIVERGEKLDKLQEKTASIKSAAKILKKKAKKQNGFFAGLCSGAGGCGGPKDD